RGRGHEEAVAIRIEGEPFFGFHRVLSRLEIEEIVLEIRRQVVRMKTAEFLELLGEDGIAAAVFLCQQALTEFAPIAESGVIERELRSNDDQNRRHEPYAEFHVLLHPVAV